MPCRDFDTLFVKLESNLSFANDTDFMEELKDSIKTVEQWVRLTKLYCDCAEKLINIIDSFFR